MSVDQFDPENDYAPASTGKTGFSAEPQDRLANAAEYSAYQLGQIKLEMRRIATALEKLSQRDD